MTRDILLSFLPRGFSKEKIDQSPKGSISAMILGWHSHRVTVGRGLLDTWHRLANPCSFPGGLGSRPSTSLAYPGEFLLQPPMSFRWSQRGVTQSISEILIPLSLIKGRLSHPSPTTFELYPPKSLGGVASHSTLWKPPECGVLFALRLPNQEERATRGGLPKDQPYWWQRPF